MQIEQPGRINDTSYVVFDGSSFVFVCAGYYSLLASSFHLFLMLFL